MNLDSLIHAEIDGEITPEQHAELENLLRSDWQARQRYLELVDQHARLLQQPTVNTGRLQKATPKRPTRRWLPALTAAAAVIACAFIFWPQHSSETEATSNGVAMLSQTMDAKFTRGSFRSGDTLKPGTIQLTQGLAQIEFFSGATALIEGSAEIEILSAWEARCLSGRVRVHVPPAAKGFLMHAPGMKLEDLGTEFALNVKDNTSAVHVFEGEVIAHTAAQTPASLKQGMSLSSANTIPASPQDFLSISELQGLVKQRDTQRFADWQQWSLTTCKDPRLIAYYTFKHLGDDRWDRLVKNFTEPRHPLRAGGAVGAAWTQGRWPEKNALEFKRPGDRVRLNLDGTYQALTFACWVKVDSIDKKYNSLLLTDGYDNGEPHWQIYEDGSLMFSVMYRPAEAAKNAKYNQMYYSKPVFTADSLGRWHHLAVTYDNTTGEVIQYFDGQPVGREISPLHQPGRPIVFGPCEIGNWGLPTQGHRFPIRNLNGAIDEFAIYSAALNPADILSIFQHGKPE
ncbi:MAG: FecR domain-containing protein [Prosthecobacter sp.]|uniref:LamG-like jellyroll fold domain-containing protein n=1 Tax=Prosthecobacter sp. TaxID=1965333 RepID=UPI0025D5E673|nr:LamG-like jellyroll fold domain-containing protein [Prosthecobacter sp.]MCF7788157.1 FecR domain-containing protein [Prosthecobacter sp.]